MLVGDAGKWFYDPAIRLAFLKIVSLPSRKEGALRRCPFALSGVTSGLTSETRSLAIRFCSFTTPQKPANLKAWLPAYRAVAKRRDRLRRDARVRYRGVTRFLPEAHEVSQIRFLFFLRPADMPQLGIPRRIAPSRKEGALTRCSCGLSRNQRADFNHEVSRSAFCSFYDRKNLPSLKVGVPSVSRRREGRLR